MNPRQLASFVLIACSCLPAFAGEKSKKLNVRTTDSVTLVGEESGKGDTAIIFLHGWCGERAYWKHQIPEFARDHHVIAIDQAGHGDSGKDRKEWTCASLASDVELIVKALKLKRVILVGHSMGGQVSLLAAKRMPGTVVAIIGVDTLPDAEYKFPEEVRQGFMAAFEKDFKGTLRGMFPGMLHEKTDPEVAKWLAARAEMQDPKMAVALMRDLSGLDLKVLMKEAKVPIRCINSSGGFKFHTPTAVETNKKYADFNAVFIENVGHYPMLERPDEFNRKMRDVLKEFATPK